MDFTLLFLVILMLLAYQSGLTYIAIGLFLAAVVTAKNKFVLAAAGIGGLALAATYLGFGEGGSWLVIGALFAIFLILAWKDEQPAGPQGYPGMPY